MKKLQIAALSLTLTLFALTSCGTWVDMPGYFIKCTDSQVEKNKKTGTSPMGRMMLDTICGKVNKKYADDLRCKDGKLQIKCN